MKREIKFRAWVKRGNEIKDYVKPTTIQQMIHSKESTFSLEQLNDLVDFEQFTGLHDKNGREIYEGDIVKYHMVRSYGDHYDPVTLGFIGTDWDVDADIIGKVSIWPSNGVMMTNVITDDPDMFCKEYPVPKRWHVTHDCEVIGNIFENQELLEGKHEQK